MLTQDKADERLSVELLIAGKLHDHWQSYDIDSDLQTPADDFNVSIGLPDGVTPPEVAAGEAVEVRVGGDTVLTGRIDAVSRKISAGQNTLSISGRDGAAVLLDCSAPIFNAQDLGLQEIVSQIVQPLGVTKVRIDAAQPAKTKKVQIEPGSSAWRALEQYAEANGVWPWFEPDGTLVVGGPDYSKPPVADLVMRQDGRNNNILEIDYSNSMAKRYSEITVLGQNHGGKHNLKGVAKDESVKVHRPLIVVESDVDDAAEAERKAKKRLADGRLDGLTIRVTVRGHRTSDGLLWTPGQRIRLLCEPLGLDGVYFLMSRNFSASRSQGAQTRLTLKEDGAWVLEANPPKSVGGKTAGSRSASGGGKGKPAAGRKRKQGTAQQDFSWRVDK